MRHYLGFFLCAATAAGCVTELEPPEELGSLEAPLESELPGGVAQLVKSYYGDPAVARTSYATPSYYGDGYCSAAMVGPNIVMTAAHCGSVDAGGWIRFRTYRGDAVASNEEWFHCDAILNTFCDSDLQLLHCAANGAGEAPGDKYGYLDLDVASPSPGQPLYSVWSNRIDSLAHDDAKIYSEGTVASESDDGWYVPRYDWGARGTLMNMYGRGGASGSSHVNPWNGRIMVGPLSLAVATGGMTRRAASMRSLLDYGHMRIGDPGCPTYDVRTDLGLWRLGLAAEAFMGDVDKDDDRVFDVQQAIERDGAQASQKDWYLLGFESERRNASWITDGASVRFEADGALVALEHVAGGRDVVMRLPAAKLGMGATYRVVFDLNTEWADAGQAVSVAVLYAGSTTVAREVAVPTTYGWGRHAVDLTVPGFGEYELGLIVAGPYRGQMSRLLVGRAGATIDFDSMDERELWANHTHGGYASIIPEGSTVGTPNWAARVARDTSVPRGSDWPVGTDMITFDPAPNTLHRFCFDQRDHKAPVRPGQWGKLRVVNADGTIAHEHAFAPATSWTNVCTPYFATTTATAWVQLAVDSDASASVGYGELSYRIDNLTLSTMTVTVVVPVWPIFRWF